MREMMRSKTVWTGVVTVVSAVGGYLSGSIPLPEAIQLGATGLTAIFLRHGVSKAAAGGQAGE